MTKDYAKKSKKRSSASRFKDDNIKKSIPGWIWLIAGLLIGIITAFIINLEAPQLTDAVVEVVKKEIPSAKSRYQAVPAEESADDFSFYNELENKVVEVPDEAPIKLKASDPNKRYIMQCGSFRKETSAETLKAQIAMNGFAAHIRATKQKSGNTWYRVSLGPYKSKRTAERERHQLERNNINNCRIW